MTTTDIRKALTNIDKNLVAQSCNFEDISQDFKREKKKHIQYSFTVFSVLIIFSVFWIDKNNLQSIPTNNTTNNNTESLNVNTTENTQINSQGIVSTSNNQTPIVSNTTEPVTAMIKEWDEKTYPQKFPTLTYKNINYMIDNDDSKIEYSKISSKLTDITLEQIDSLTDNKYSIRASLYSIRNIDTNCMIAVRYKDENDYYTFINPEFTISSLHELMQALDWDNNVQFGNIYYFENGQIKNEFNDYNRSNIQNYIYSKKDTVKCENEIASASILEIGLNMPALGIYNKTLSLTKSGYMQTNITHSENSFYFGDECTNEILHLICK